jgi:MFS family permease
LVVFLTVFIDLLGFGIIIPLLPIYSSAYGASETQLGLLFACFSGMQFFFAPMWGRISDRIGRRPVLIGGLVGTALSYLVFAYAESIGVALHGAMSPGRGDPQRWTLGVLFASRVLAGFFGANVSTASAYIADVTTPENRAKGMGLIGAAFGLGFTLGPALGGELSHLSVHLPGLAAAVLSLFAATFGWFKLVEPPRTERKFSRVFGFDQVRRAFADPRIGWVLVLAFLSIFAFSCFESMFLPFGLQKYWTYFGLDQPLFAASSAQKLAAGRYAGRYLFVVGMISALIQGGLIRRLVPRFGETRLIVAGPLLLAAGLAIIGASTSWSMVILGCVVMPCGFGINNPSVNSLVSRAAPGDQQGAYLGLQQSLASLARMTGPPCAGWLFQHVGAPAPFVSAAGVLVVASLLAYAYHRRFAATFARAAA